MKIPKIAKSVGCIDDELIVKAIESKKKVTHNIWFKCGALAACFTATVIISSIIFPLFFSKNVTSDKTDNRYKDYNIYANETAIIWPWESLTVYEKYTQLAIEDVKYASRGGPISQSLVGELIGTYSVSGYDEYTESKPTSDFEVYQLKYADRTQFVAVMMEGSYYVFKNDEYSPPDTLGELFSLVDFPKTVQLYRFSENGDGADKKHFELYNDDYVWTVLEDCKEAPFVEDKNWNSFDRDYLSFTISSETLGVYKVAMYITEDGFLWTNAFSWQYLFNIGQDAAKKIIKYAKENSEQAEFEPYSKSVAGKIVDITEEYILVDDSILCNNPAEGITYKILLNDLRVTRYIDKGCVKINDTVLVYYNGEINAENEHTINTATYITEATISFEDISVTE